MSYWANLNENNVVINVIYVDNKDMADPEAEKWVTDTLGGIWKQTSYNSSIRKNYAGIGFTYDESLDAFIAPKPEGNGWVLNTETCQWENSLLEDEFTQITEG